MCVMIVCEDRSLFVVVVYCVLGEFGERDCFVWRVFDLYCVVLNFEIFWIGFEFGCGEFEGLSVCCFSGFDDGGVDGVYCF